MYFTATIQNIPERGIIKIQSISIGDAPGDVNLVRIKRKISGSMVLTKIKEIPIAAKEDFTFSVEDNECRSRASYDYQIIPVNSSNNELLGQMLTIKSVFDGIYISDSTGEWICDLNPTYEYDINTSVNYVKPLKGRFPIRVSNGDTRYASGSVQGLFLPKDASGCYTDTKAIIDAARAYKSALLDFLCNGETKLLKTYDGQVWRVGIDANPKEMDATVIGASEIKFGWTEIEAPPVV